MKDYYHKPTSLWRKLRCAFRLITVLGHDFEIQYTEERRWEPDTDFRVGEMAYVCRLCFRVEDRKDYRVIPDILYILERRQVDHLPLAPDGQEPLCGVAAPANMYRGSGISLQVRCRKFAWHVRSDDRTMRPHDGMLPVPGGHRSFIWNEPKEVTA